MSNLQNAPEHHIRAILLALCRRDRKIEREAETMLEHLEMFEKSRIERTQAGQATSRSTAGVKRKVASMDDDMTGMDADGENSEAAEICVNCGQPFSAATNGDSACLSHPEGATTEPDMESDFWEDHDESAFGQIDTQEMRDEYPDGFIWTCCKQSGTHPGCQKTSHKSRQDPVMRTEG